LRQDQNALAHVHNAVGYVLGYWGSRLLRLPERACRTVAFEVGLQNGGTLGLGDKFRCPTRRRLESFRFDATVERQLLASSFR